MPETVNAARRLSALADASGPAVIRPLLGTARFSLRVREEDAANIASVAEMVSHLQRMQKRNRDENREKSRPGLS